MSFTCFSNLPTELRLKIWQAALQPRIITISRPHHKAPLRGTCTSPEHTTLKSLLLTCKISFETVLKNYTLYFHTRIDQPIPFNPHLDTLKFLNDAELSPFLRPQYGLLQQPSWDIQEVKRFILPHPYNSGDESQNFMSRRTSCAIILATLQDFGNVEKVGLMASETMKKEEVLEFIGEVEMYFEESEGLIVGGMKVAKVILGNVEFTILDERYDS